ncbi:MAG: hypothetical protein WC889_05420 [Myxococcota bacterium]|jgi:hypothetical protein
MNNKHPVKIILIAAALIAVFIASSGAKSMATALRGGKDQLPDEIEFPPDKNVIKATSLGYGEVIADYYWLKAIQWFGGKTMPTENKISSLYPLTDLISELAPLFDSNYRLGHIMLTARDTNEDLSMKLLSKGRINRPDVWQIPYYQGFIAWYFKTNAKLAAVYYDDAATLGPMEMKWLHLLSAKLFSNGDNPDLAVAIMENLVANPETNNEETIEHYKKNLKLAIMTRDIAHLEMAVKKFKLDFNRLPASLQELVEKGIIPEIPGEPHKGVYELKPDGKVVSTGSTDRFRAAHAKTDKAID